VPAFFFIIISFLTKWITTSAEVSWWGFYLIRGFLYLPYALYIAIYVIIGLLLCLKFYRFENSYEKKIQTKFLIIAVSIPLVGGILTQIIPEAIGFKMIPMTSMLTTFTALIIAYAINKHKLVSKNFFSLYTKLVASFLVVVLLVIIGAFSIVQSRDILEENIVDRSLLSVSTTMEKIDKSIEWRIREFQIQVDSKNKGFQDLIKQSNQEFSSIGSDQDILDYIFSVDEEWISTNSFIPLYYDLINNSITKRLMRNIDFYKDKYQFDLFGEIFLTNKYGANIGQTGITSDYYQADEDWWIIGKENGIFIGDVGYDESAGMYSVDIVIRINDANGNFIGMLKAVWNIQEIIDILENVKNSNIVNLYESMVGSLIDSDGRLIYSTNDFIFF
jgi:hypothetical protein